MVVLATARVETAEAVEMAIRADCERPVTKEAETEAETEAKFDGGSRAGHGGAGHSGAGHGGAGGGDAGGGGAGGDGAEGNSSSIDGDGGD